MGQNISGHGGRHPGGLLRHHTGPHPGVGPPAAGPEAPAAPSGGGGQPLLRLAGEPAMALDSVAAVGERINPTGRRKLKEALYAKNWDYAVGAGPPGAAGGGGLPGGQRPGSRTSTRGRPCPIWSWPSSGCRPCPWSSTAPTPPPWSGPSGSAGAGPS